MFLWLEGIFRMRSINQLAHQNDYNLLGEIYVHGWVISICFGNGNVHFNQDLDFIARKRSTKKRKKNYLFSANIFLTNINQ